LQATVSQLQGRHKCYPISKKGGSTSVPFLKSRQQSTAGALSSKVSEVRQRREKTSMAESRPAGQTKEREGTAQAVEAGTGILGEV